MNFCIDKQQLENALALVNKAIENGFKDSLAVLQLYTGGETVSDFLARSNGVILKADPIDGKKNWGHTNYPEWQKYENGEIVDV